MKIYLDIDGTLIHEELGPNFGKPAAGLEEFLSALRTYDSHWLTTHCRDGDPEQARRVMKRVLPEDSYGDIDRIKPTTWDTLKTEALDWESDFIWFDNDVAPEELEALKACGPTQQLIQVNLREDPKQLIEITRDILQN